MKKLRTTISELIPSFQVSIFFFKTTKTSSQGILFNSYILGSTFIISNPPTNLSSTSEMDVAPWIAHWIMMVSDYRWYLMVFNCIRWYLMVLNGIEWYSMVFCGILVFNSIHWYSMVFDGFRWYSMVLQAITWYSIVFYLY